MKPKKPTKKQLLGKTTMAWAVSEATGLLPFLHFTRADAMGCRRGNETVVRVLVTVVDDKAKQQETDR